MAEMFSRYPRSSSRSLAPARQHAAYPASKPWEDQRSMDSQRINNENVANVVGRLAVEGACARAHKLLGKVHVEVIARDGRKLRLRCRTSQVLVLQEYYIEAYGTDVQYDGEERVERLA